MNTTRHTSKRRHSRNICWKASYFGLRLLLLAELVVSARAWGEMCRWCMPATWISLNREERKLVCCRSVNIATSSLEVGALARDRLETKHVMFRSRVVTRQEELRRNFGLCSRCAGASASQRCLENKTLENAAHQKKQWGVCMKHVPADVHSSSCQRVEMHAMLGTLIMASTRAIWLRNSRRYQKRRYVRVLLTRVCCWGGDIEGRGRGSRSQKCVPNQMLVTAVHTTADLYLLACASSEAAERH